jgi:transposase
MQCMDRPSLEQLLDQGLSLAEIGKRVDLHEATVGYWVKKHGLRAVNQDKYAARGGLERAELERLVAEGASIAQIADTMGRSKGAVRHWLGKYGLNTTNAGGGPSREGAREARAAGLSETVLTCPHHGLYEHVREPRGYYRCRKCRQDAVVRRRRKVKQILVEEAGGRCKLCGYDRCLAALQFHHIDPTAKQFGVAQYGAARSIDRLRAEIRKCVLLCSNCHAEAEAGFVELSAVLSMSDDNDLAVS